MKRGVFLAVVLTVVLIFQTSLCFSKEFINISLVPDPSPSCSQLVFDFAVTENSTLGVSPASCNSNRPTYGKPNSAVRNNFNRIIIPWRYSPNGVFKDGYYVMATIGVEKDEFTSASGSTANVTFMGTSIHTGYQWFWRNGFNVTFLISASHLARHSLSKSISPTESGDVVDFLGKR